MRTLREECQLRLKRTQWQAIFSQGEEEVRFVGKEGEVAAVHNVDDEPEWIDPAPREERRRVTRVDRVPVLRDSERNCGSSLMGSAGGALVPVRARGIR